MTIRLFVTGGTVDKQYNAHNGALHFVDSHITELLALGRCTVTVNVEQLMLKDSLEMDDHDRARLAASCAAAVEERIVITHGTDTMVATAQAVAAEQLAKTIVLTGAMVPFIMKHSDGMFNLGGAITAVQCLPHGVYLAMNGAVYPWDNVVKNLDALRFESLTG